MIINGVNLAMWFFTLTGFISLIIIASNRRHYRLPIIVVTGVGYWPRYSPSGLLLCRQAAVLQRRERAIQQAIERKVRCITVVFTKNPNAIPVFI